MTHRDRLIAALPADLQAKALEALVGHSPDGDDVVEALFAAAYDIENRNTAALRTEIQTLREALRSMADNNAELRKTVSNSFRDASAADKTTHRAIASLQPTAPWARAVLGRVTSWIIVAIINTICLVAGLQYLLQRQDAQLHAIFADGDKWKAFAETTYQALVKGRQYAAGNVAATALLGVPSGKMERRGDKLAISYPNNSIKVETNAQTTTIILDAAHERLRTAFGPTYWQYDQEAQNAQDAVDGAMKTIDNGKE